MATETLVVQHTASKNVYFALFESDGDVFDFNDNTFKAIAGATTPYVAATEESDLGGVGRSVYVASVNLANVHDHGVPKDVIVQAYERAGGTPAPLTDTVIALPSYVKVQFAEVGELPLTVEIVPCFTSTAGTEVRLFAKLMRGGKPVPIATYDAGATLALAVREHGAVGDLFTIGATVVGASHVWELTQAAPGYTADRLYKYTATLVENGNTHTDLDVTFVPNLG